MPRKKTHKGKKKSPGKLPFTSVEELMEQGSNALATTDLELARDIYNQALLMAPHDTNVMDALAGVQMQLGESENALDLLIQSTSSAPSENPCKWFSLGQLQSGTESVDSYRAGIQYLSSSIDNDTSVRYSFLIRSLITLFIYSNSNCFAQLGEDSSELVKQLARAHCSIAEVYLTDLWYKNE